MIVVVWIGISDGLRSVVGVWTPLFLWREEGSSEEKDCSVYY
jgi:hypothetical protein